MTATTAAFLAITAVLVAFHVRRHVGGSKAAAAPARPCARCGEPLARGTATCAGCGVPQQIFEVTAREVAAEPSGESAGGPVHAIVRADMCVGCGACVSVCPEDGAIRLDGKLAVVEIDACTGSGQCAEACPVSAIVVAAGGSVHRVEVPDVRNDFQSNLPGVYIAGELGGRGLIKNAINEGKIAVESIVGELSREGSHADGDPDAVDVAIVGAGPAGMSAGLEALSAGLSYVILEQGTLADSIRRYPRHKLLLAEPVHIPLYGDLWIADASKETLLSVWESIIAKTGLEVKTGHRVERVEREGEVFRLETGEGSFRARRVVLAIGRRGTPRRLGVPGEQRANVFYDIAEMEAFVGRRVLVVGGGDSAVESALGLAKQEGTSVSLSYRGEAFRRVKDRNRDKLDAAVSRGTVDLFLSSQVREIHDEEVVLDIVGGTQVLPNDDVVVRVGGEPPHAFLERLGVRIVRKDVPLAEKGSEGVG